MIFHGLRQFVLKIKPSKVLPTGSKVLRAYVHKEWGNNRQFESGCCEVVAPTSDSIKATPFFPLVLSLLSTLCA